MKKYNILFSVLILFLIISVSCNNIEKKILAQINDTIIVNKPNESFNVKRYCDDFGNQIGYDSVYTYSYSYSGNGQNQIDMDSLFNQFGNFDFNFSNSPNGFYFGNDDFFNNFFNTNPQFNNQNFYFDNNIDLQEIMKQHQKQFDEMQKMMDSLKNLKSEDKKKINYSKVYNI